MIAHYTNVNNKRKVNRNLPERFVLCMILILIVLLTVKESSAQICCPQFKIQDAVEICPPEGACKGGGTAGGTGHGLIACKLIIHEYTAYPNDPGFTYTWTITGGTPASFTGNPINILWGSGAIGYIKLVVSNVGSGGYCVDSITQEVCLIDGPKANFTLSSDTVCVNSPVQFTNTSSAGSSYLWDFGDGTTSSLATPPAHNYSLPGTYTVTLTASNSGPANQTPDMRPPCGCIDKITKTVTVLNGVSPTIDVTCCYGTVCAGDTSSFCTSAVCSTYTWTVTGGVIISGLGTNCIKVKWNNTYSGPTTVSLAVPGCATSPCAGTTTLNVPVLYPNLPINGPTTLCVGASGSYFLPTLPGTYYLWTTNAPPGFFSFNDKNKNTPNVNISFSLPGTYQLQCQYNNPMAGCNGSSTITINVLPVFSMQGDETVCQGDSIPYNTNGPATWAVTPAGATVPAGILSTAYITFNNPGTFTITATNMSPGVFCNPDAVKVVKVIAKPILGTISGPVQVCPGKNFTYSITSNTQGSPFVWSVTGGGSVMSEIGADRDSAIIKLTGLGPWTIKVFQKIEISPGNFCQSLTKTLSVTRYPAPTITGNGSVCVDAVETYTATGPVPPGGIQWTISPAYQGSVISQTGNTANIKWHGTPNTAIITASHCGGTATKSVAIAYPPAVSPISMNGPNGYCWPNLPNNITLSTTSGFPSYQWFLNNSPIFGANAFSYNIPNGTFTGIGTYYFSVAVSNGSCTIYQTTYIFIDSCAGGSGGTPTNPIICDVDFSINPNPACVDQPITFTAIPTGPGFSYSWDFGDNATSFQSPTQHTYTSPGTDTVTLTATIGTCVVVKKKVVTVNPSPSCIITASDTAFCPGNSVTLTACNFMNSYQWYKDGTLISGATSQTYNVTQHGEYEVEVTNNFGCASRSNSLYIYKKTPPIAKVTGEGLVCAFPNAFNQFPLSAYYDPAYVYDWSSNAGGATFTPNNSNMSSSTTVGLALPALLPVTYYFVVKVTDTVTTCSSRDTLCVTFYETPALTFPYNAGCQGSPMTFTPSIIDTTNFKYHWSSGQSTPVITVNSPGSYALTITNKISGCSATVTAGTIYPKPDLSLFPDGCDSIMCKTDTLRMYIPLPLSFNPPFNTYPNAYPTIEWFDNGNYGTPIATGQNFTFVYPTSGSHQISVVVTTNHGCTDTTGVFCLTVLCGDIQFNCPTAPIMLPCNSTPPTSADALAALGAITDSCPGPINTTITGGIATPISGCWWKSVFKIIASNGCGQIDSCFVTFHWKEDHEPPYFLNCPGSPIILPCNSTHPTITDASVAAGPVGDNCPGTVNTVITGGIPTPLSGCDWTSTFTITATDSCNNSSVCTIVYQWKEDTIPPQFAHCPTGPITLPCNANPPVEDEPLIAVGPITDNCPGPITVVKTGGTPIPIAGCKWKAIFTITATDACGNSNVCTVVYRWKEDHLPPVFSHCPLGPINLPCNSPRPNEADAMAAVGPVTDNCPDSLNIVMSGGQATPTTGCNWTATFSISATDSCGNTATCNITYNWKEDTVPPQFAHCPQGPINLPCNVKPIVGEVLYDIGPITDNCPGHIDVQVTGGTPVPTTGCNWTTTYAITATDSCGNVSTCSVTYNWKEDQIPPTIAHCPSGPINLPCNSPRPTETDALTVAGPITDNCPGVIIQVAGGQATQTNGCNWTATFTISATDSCGNTASCVIVYNWKEDTTPPQFAHCPQGPVNLPCNVKPIVGEILYDIGPITDDCPGQVDVQVTGGTPVPTTGCNWTATYIITATDLCGNVNACSVTYNWKEDNSTPVFAGCPTEPVQLPCNSPRPTEADAISFAGGISDGCSGILNITVSGGTPVPATDCNWTSTFTIYAADSCGNTAQCTITFNWKEDQIPPVFAHCPVRPISRPCNAPRPTTADAILAAGPVIDNCYVDFLQVTDGGVVITTGCWLTQTFTLTATDGCGNVATCRVTYRWKEDNIAPVFAHCPPGPIELPCNAPRPTLSGALGAAGNVTDNCPGNVFVVYCLPPNSGHYDYPATLSYNPEIAIRNFSQFNFTNCNPPPVTIGQAEIQTYGSSVSFDLSTDGGNTWTLVNAFAETTIRITKVEENETEQFFETEILALNISGGTLPEGILIRESPTLSSHGESRIQTNSNGEDFQIDSFFDVFTEISSNNGQSWIIAPNPWNINLSGPIIVVVSGGPVTPTSGCGLTQTFTLTAKDGCGNISTCNVVYNWKEDHTPPVFAHCPVDQITLPCNPPRPTSNDALLAAGNVTDNCPGSVFVQVADSGPQSSGPCTWMQTFTITATDGCGNSSVCHVTYNWTEDHIPPTFTRPVDITIYFGTNGNYNASVSVTGDVTDENDNCATGLNATYTDQVYSGILPVWKVIKRTWTLVDPCGNTALSQIQTINVADPHGGKEITLSLFLEGLYNGNGTLRKAQNALGNKFEGDTADIISVELHDLSDYSHVVYRADVFVSLSVTGTSVFLIPSFINNSYYLTIRHRNSIETTSAFPVDFSGNTISYSFDSPAKAFGQNMGVMLDGSAVIYVGDVNQDGLIDGSDMSNIGNENELFSTGYLVEDINGDGLVDGSDLCISGNNNDGFIESILP